MKPADAQIISRGYDGKYLPLSKNADGCDVWVFKEDTTLYPTGQFSQ